MIMLLSGIRTMTRTAKMSNEEKATIRERVSQAMAEVTSSVPVRDRLARLAIFRSLARWFMKNRRDFEKTFG
jgi:hypothetical protein